MPKHNLHVMRTKKKVSCHSKKITGTSFFSVPVKDHAGDLLLFLRDFIRYKLKLFVLNGGLLVLIGVNDTFTACINRDGDRN